MTEPSESRLPFAHPLDLVICDIDGCLAPETSEPFDLEGLRKVAAYNRRAFARGDGPPITVCTGRPEPFAEAVCRLIGNEQVPCIAENGTWLYFPTANEYSRDPAITTEHLEVVHDAAIELDRRFASRGVTQQPGKTASVTLYHPDNNYLQAILPEVRDLAEGRGWPFRVTMTWLYINCDLEFVSKGSGIRRLFEATGLRPDRTLGIGDTVSDLAMAEIVRVFAAPGNAADEVKSRADYVSPYDEVDGVLDILQHAVKKEG